ncbi:MAG: hypothetical protein KDK51_06260 [Deltaproteobacteria bacterium]|nr:hypothetical protein [Deltaproteobacteria bacterium]
MNNFMIAVICIQAILNVYFWKNLPEAPSPKKTAKQSVKKPAATAKEQSSAPMTSQEIYVYTLELDEDVRKLTHEVEKLKQKQAHMQGASSTEKTVQADTAKVQKNRESNNDYDVSQLQEIQVNFSQLDSDGNGKLEANEFTFQKDVLQLIDLDLDAMVSDKELKRFFTFLENAKDHAKQRDQNDGMFPIAKDEYSGGDKRFGFIDSNKDGILSEEEYIKYRKQGLLERRRFDIDKNGYISPEEFGQGQVRFEKIDENNNGQIETYEIRKAMYMGYW